jgi:hypothetical protein
MSFIGTNDDPFFGSAGITGLSSFLSGFKKYYPNCPFLLCATYPTIPVGGVATSSVIESLGQRAAALKYNYSFFDGNTPFVNFPTFSGRFGASDGIHATTTGFTAYSEILNSWFNVLEG